MVRSLLRAGFPVVAYDLVTQLTQAAVKEGAAQGSSPADVAARSDVVLSSLPDPLAVEQAALGLDGIIEGIRPGQVYIDLSTIDPGTSRKVGAALAEKGAQMLDVPVGKGPAAAAAGDLTLMVGGDPAVVEEVQDVLRGARLLAVLLRPARQRHGDQADQQPRVLLDGGARRRGDGARGQGGRRSRTWSAR